MISELGRCLFVSVPFRQVHPDVSACCYTPVLWRVQSRPIKLVRGGNWSDLHNLETFSIYLYIDI